jgi:hypothetical protein
MRSLDVAIATCTYFSEPDPDAMPLAEALEAAGVNAKWLAWDDPSSDFSSAKMTVIRSTWNYTQAHEAFLAWIDKTAAVTDLHNPAAVVRSNVHKKYLLDLAARGIPTIPTRIVPQASTTNLAEISGDLHATEVVIKPAVSAASSRTIRADVSSDRARDHFRALVASGDTMVQPYFPSVEGYGERSIICIDDEISHSIRKSPRFEGDEQVTSVAMPIDAAEAALAKKVLATFSEPLLYARVDVVRDANDSPVLMELELTEPSLFLDQSPQGLERFVRAIVGRLRRSSTSVIASS